MAASGTRPSSQGGELGGGESGEPQPPSGPPPAPLCAAVGCRGVRPAGSQLLPPAAASAGPAATDACSSSASSASSWRRHRRPSYVASEPTCRRVPLLPGAWEAAGAGWADAAAGNGDGITAAEGAAAAGAAVEGPRLGHGGLPLGSHIAAVGCRAARGADASRCSCPPPAAPPSAAAPASSSCAQYSLQAGTCRRSSSAGAWPGLACAASRIASSPGIHATELAASCSTASGSRWHSRHSLTVPSSDAVARNAPQLVKLQACTLRLWAARHARCAAACWPAGQRARLGRCQTRTTASSPAVASRPLGLCSSIALMPPWCSVSVATWKCKEQRRRSGGGGEQA